MVSTLGTARMAPWKSKLTRRSVESVSGSPPLTMTSLTSGCAERYANAGASASRDRAPRRRLTYARPRAEPGNRRCSGPSRKGAPGPDVPAGRGAGATSCATSASGSSEIAGRGSRSPRARRERTAAAYWARRDLASSQRRQIVGRDGEGQPRPPRRRRAPCRAHARVSCRAGARGRRASVTAWRICQRQSRPGRRSRDGGSGASAVRAS